MRLRALLSRLEGGSARLAELEEEHTRERAEWERQRWQWSRDREGLESQLREARLEVKRLEDARAAAGRREKERALGRVLGKCRRGALRIFLSQWRTQAGMGFAMEHALGA